MEPCDYCYNDPCDCSLPTVEEITARIGPDELTYGDLFAGYGGLTLGVQSVLPGRTAWYADVCKFNKDGTAGHYSPHRSPCAIMRHHHPDVPNLGDVSRVDWAAVEPVDVITGGSPCQDLSHAGKRRGMKAGTRSGLWASMCDAVDIIRPALVVWENVRGALSAEATSAVEPCPFCLGDDPGVTLRALGRVLGDLTELGYDARWYGLRAADVGAAHGRFRIFLFATPAGDRRILNRLNPVGLAAGGPAPSGVTLLPTPMTEPNTGNGHARNLGKEVRDLPDPTLLPTPMTTDSHGPGMHGRGGMDLRTAVHENLIPTPTASDYKGSSTERREAGKHRGQLDAFTEGDTLLPTPRASEPGSSSPGYGKGLAETVETTTLLPTPKASNNENRCSPEYGPNLGTAVGVFQGCATCGCSIDLHDGDGFCCGPCGGNGHNCYGRLGPGEIPLLPTPAVNDMGADKDPDEFDAWRQRQKSATGRTAVHGKSLAVEARRTTDRTATAKETPPEPAALFSVAALLATDDDVDPNGDDEIISDLEDDDGRLLPTPLATEGEAELTDPYHRQKRAARDGNSPREQLNDVVRQVPAGQLLPTPQTVDAVMNTPASERGTHQVMLSNMAADGYDHSWGDYAPAVNRWARIIGRPAPAPTEISPKGLPRLSPRFVEWLMGLPAGHVTATGIGRNEELKALGNGVVPQQAAAATTAFIHDLANDRSVTP